MDLYLSYFPRTVFILSLHASLAYENTTCNATLNHSETIMGT